MDIFSKEKRSEIMALVKSKDTKIENIVRKYLFSQGFRYKKNVAELPGRPDIVLPKYKTVIFVHGCFWHGHQGCKRSTIPKTRTDFWLEKINGNIKRDNKNIEQLKSMGWNVVIVWQCELQKNFNERVQQLVREIKDYK
ncbi:very short patch repair endonuclease [Acetivibrio straminisolvens]|jgi:DNA mismatch endonuclease (patch repair protein)|uniref:very short patch repair endonuclease n=1 Tax=Acetivibrio straminisolvens TaxID=253314 RepID=UPI00223EAA87|nr:DNA mismatch endonuclease Vsr [Acetivibrio straminisolvens]